VPQESRSEDSPLVRRVRELGEKAARQSQAKKASAAPVEVPRQLPFWEEDERGLPNSLARGALFTAAKCDKTLKREFYEGKKIASLSNLSIEYAGPELRQDDASVFMTLLHLGRHTPLGQPIHFTAYSMLKELGWSINSAEYKHLRECCTRLSATNATVTTPEDDQGYAGSLVRTFAWKDDKGKQMQHWVVWLEPAIAELFSQNTFSLLEWGERKKIGGRAPLALWLHSFLCTHREPHAMSVQKYYELCASKTAQLADFRRRLKMALQKLVEIGFILKFEIRDDKVHIVRAAKQFKAPIIRSVPQLESMV
jgi:hypothetical protein